MGLWRRRRTATKSWTGTLDRFRRKGRSIRLALRGLLDPAIGHFAKLNAMIFGGLRKGVKSASGCVENVLTKKIVGGLGLRL